MCCDQKKRCYVAVTPSPYRFSNQRAYAPGVMLITSRRSNDTDNNEMKQETIQDFLEFILWLRKYLKISPEGYATSHRLKWYPYLKVTSASLHSTS